jgi:hypothetical protein
MGRSTSSGTSSISRTPTEVGDQEADLAGTDSVGQLAGQHIDRRDRRRGLDRRQQRIQLQRRSLTLTYDALSYASVLNTASAALVPNHQSPADVLANLRRIARSEHRWEWHAALELFDLPPRLREPRSPLKRERSNELGEGVFEDDLKTENLGAGLSPELTGRD